MATKPTENPAWATGTNYAIGPRIGYPNKVLPTSGKILDGFRPREKPNAQLWNWILNNHGKWLTYLKDGAFSGDHSIDGDLDVTGDVSADGNASFGGTLAVDDNTTVGGTLGVTGLVTAQAGVTAIPGQSFQVSGGGDYYDLGGQPWVLSGIEAVGDAITYDHGVSGATGDFVESTGGGWIRWRLPLQPGDRIGPSFTFAVWGDGVADVTAANLIKITAAGSTTTLASTAANNPTNTWTDVTTSVVQTAAATVGTGEHIYFEVQCNAAGLAFNALRGTKSRPHP